MLFPWLGRAFRFSLLAAVALALSATSAFAATPPANTVAPTLSGSAQDGKTLTAAKGTWTGTAPITYTYQWQQSTDAGLTWSSISGATASTYTPPAGSAGELVDVVVTATNAGGSAQATSAPSAVILASPPVNSVAPSLSGTAQDGKALTASKGTWIGVATITYTYQWQQSSNGGATWSTIAGATSSSYTPPAGSAGQQVEVVVTATNGDGSAQATSPASAAIVANPPVATVAPSLSGTAQDGKALTAARGTWNGVATITYTYQWQQSTDGGATWTAIAGATGTSYTPPAGSAGNEVNVVVTATNGDGTAQATSPASAAIIAYPPANTVAPSLSGTAQDGVKLTAGKGTWNGVATIAYTYQWQQSTDGGATWTAIAGATASTYTPPAGSAGEQVEVVVTATNGDGTAQAASPASAVILANPPVNTVAPSLSGTAQDGVKLTAAKGTWTGMATITNTYQWQQSTDGGATWANIAGATATTYTPPAGSAGKQVRVVVTGTNGDGAVQAASPASAAIVANPPVDTVAPSVSGTAQDGKPLTAAKGTWTGMATITYTYQWQQSTDGGATWSTIAGATATTYTPPAGSAGNEVNVVVTATNSDGSVQAMSPASAVILANPPVNTVAPSLSGAAQDGVALTAASGTWTGLATIITTDQWQQSTDGGTTWSDIAGATGSSYTPPAGSAGTQIHVVVTATNGDGTAQAISSASTVLGNPPVNTGAPSVSGTAEDGATLTAAAGTWSGVATIATTYQWQQSSDGGATWSDIAGATAATYTPPAGSAGKRVRVVVTATNGDGTAQTPSPASAAILGDPPANTVAPGLSGTAQEGKTLTAAKGTWTGIATITYAYQWQQSTDGGATWVTIAGATGSSYLLPAGFAGTQVQAVVTATNGDGSAQATSPTSAIILSSPPATPAVTISSSTQPSSAPHPLAPSPSPHLPDSTAKARVQDVPSAAKLKAKKSTSKTKKPKPKHKPVKQKPKQLLADRRKQKHVVVTRRTFVTR